MEFTYGISDDYLDDDDDGVMYSTKNYSSGSDDEISSVFTLGRKSQKRKSMEKARAPPEQDDFEKEMAAELNATVRFLTANASSSGSKNEVPNSAGESEYYDRIYFDSDESSSDEEDNPDSQQSNGAKRKNKHRVLTNDELLYDPLMDDADQAWVDSNRRSYQVNRQRKLTRTGEYKHQPLPQSDAVLNCPACFTTLCLDCQRHEIYKNQYRAMFVFNCTVDTSEMLHFAVKEDKKKKFKKRKNNRHTETDPATAANSQSETVQDSATAANSKSEPLQDSNGVPENMQGSDDTFHPVMCTICNTKVGVQDQNEVHHFFNVLTSY